MKNIGEFTKSHLSFNFEKQIDRSMRLSLMDAFFYSLMVGAGETFLPAYAISLGSGQITAGILTSLPLVTGAFLQLFTPKLVQKLGNPKWWVVSSVLVQACAFLPLVFFSSLNKPDIVFLFLIFTLYWASGFSVNPFWTYWMSQLIPEAEKNKYFSVRAKISQVGLIIGLVAGGLALNYKVEFLPFSSVFGGLFFVAFLCRLLSGVVLSRKTYKAEWSGVLKEQNFSLKETLNFIRKSSKERSFLFSLFPFYASVFISAPFVNPFMLAQLKMEYSHYMGALVALLIGKFFCSWYLEQRSQKITPYGVFFWGVLLISPGPLMWGVSNGLIYIMMLQFFSGMAWACFEVGIQLILFKKVSLREKIPFVSMYNFFMSLAAIIGTFIGAQSLRWLTLSYDSYINLFLFGGVVRFLTAFPLLRMIYHLGRSSAKEAEAELTSQTTAA
ncbi:MAG: MFS transporter [Bdellovibrionaceae bacterium]|nr:MFS transporter [Pseudobdellovibrionaceae bacterium]NUM58253.1 MFS transporter [Pseudobdellovibrionaceae bacterium]